VDRAADQIILSSESDLKQTADLMGGNTAAIKSDIDHAALNAENIVRLNRDNMEIRGSMLTWGLERRLIEESVGEAIYLSKISSVKILTDNALASDESTMIKPLMNMDDTPWRVRALSKHETYFWDKTEDLGMENPGSGFIAFTRNLTYTYNAYPTYFVGFVKRQVFEQLLSGNISDVYTSYYIINSADTLLMGRNQYDEEIFNMVNAAVRRWQDATDSPMRVREISLSNGAHFIGSRKIAGTDMTLIYDYAASEMIADTFRENLARIGLILLAILPVVMLFSYFTAASITKPIDHLRNHMLKVGEGEIDVEIIPQVSDYEVNMLIRTFNYMLTKISMLLDERFMYGQQIKDLELKALQAQINPHLLYNTLDLIRWKAVRDHNAEIQELVSALSSYYRQGLSCGAPLVTLKAESEHVMSYVRIQNMRFDNRINLTIDIEDGCENCILPKLILQPLAENAIIHGIFEKDAAGRLLIKAWKAEGNVIMAVVDDGKGMCMEDAENLADYKPKQPELQSGYGIKNVLQRLEITYMGRARIDFLSRLGRGTAICITAPFIADLEEIHV
jgi:two-component system sensor histidine kinase YesM